MVTLIGNTLASIDECLHYIYAYTPRTSLRVSVVCTWGKVVYTIGDDLGVVDSKTLRIRKKRWWERRDPSQLRLPFSLYSPAEVLNLNRSYNGENYELDISYSNASNKKAKLRLGFYPNSLPPTSVNFLSPIWAIRAIKVHEFTSAGGPQRENG